MAERYSGNVAVRLTYDAEKRAYETRVTVGRKACDVRVNVPPRSRINVESAKAIDQAARAAIAFALGDRELGAEPSRARGLVIFKRKRATARKAPARKVTARKSKAKRTTTKRTTTKRTTTKRTRAAKPGDGRGVKNRGGLTLAAWCKAAGKSDKDADAIRAW